MAADPTSSLTPEQISRFRDDGFLSIGALTTPEEVAQIREIYDRLFEMRAGWDEGMYHDLAGTEEEGATEQIPQIMKPALRKYAPELFETELLANAVNIGRQILGDDCLCEVQHAILKPGGGPETPWHQDAAYMGGGCFLRTFSFWVPLQPVTVENGCMQFVRGSHQRDVFEHRSMNDNPRIHALELTPEEMGNVVDPVACPLPAGGAALHDSYTLHYAGPNQTDGERRALILKAQIEPVPTGKPRTFPWMEAWDTAGMKREKASDT